MQRDEFLPLRVIRQELAAGKIGGERDRGVRAASSRRAMTLEEPDEWVGHDDVIEQTGASAELIRELEEFGIVQPKQRNGIEDLRRDRRRDRPRRDRARRASASAAATSGSSGPPPTASRPCSSS